MGKGNGEKGSSHFPIPMPYPPHVTPTYNPPIQNRRHIFRLGPGKRLQKLSAAIEAHYNEVGPRGCRCLANGNRN